MLHLMQKDKSNIVHFSELQQRVDNDPAMLYDQNGKLMRWQKQSEKHVQ